MMLLECSHEKVLERLIEERDAARAYARLGDTYQHDMAAARSWAFSLAVHLLDGTEPIEAGGV